MKAYKRVLGIIISVIMLATMLPVAVFADEPEQLPAPANLHWRTETSVPVMAAWDPVEPLDTKEEDRTVAGYQVQAFYTDGEITANTDPLEQPKWDGAYIFRDFFNAHGAGTYYFKIQTIAKEGSGKADSAVVQSAPVSFRKLNVTYVTKNVDGEVSETVDGHEEAGSGGDGYFKLSESAARYYATTDLWPSDLQIKFQALPERGYQFKGFEFQKAPADLSVSNKEASFTLGDSDRNLTLTFQADETLVPVVFEFGEKHAGLASLVQQAIQEEGDYNSSVAGSKLTLQWFLADTLNGPASYVGGIMDDMIEDDPALAKDAGEYLFYSGMGFSALKTLEKYSGYEDLSKELQTYGDTDVAANTLFYMLWQKAADSASITVKAPKCGTKVELKQAEEYDRPMQVPTPGITADKTSQLQIAEIANLWFSTKQIDWMDFMFRSKNWFQGTMTGGKQYIAGFMAAPGFGYYIDAKKLPSVTINGKKADPIIPDYSPQPLDPDGVVPIGDGDGYDDGLIPIGGGDDGGGSDESDYVEALMFVTEVEAVHNWGAWKQTKAPTTTKEGEEARTCKYCGAKETRPIPKLKPAKENVFTEANIPARTMKMTWKKTKGAVGYKVAYRERGGKWTKKTVKKTSYTIEGMKKNKFYEFKVAPIVKKGKKKVTGKYKDISYRYFNAVKGKAKGVKGGVKLSWTKESKAKGYIVYCSTSKKMKKYKEVTLKGKNKKNYTFKGLKKGKTYYVMVRSYIKKGGKKYLGVTCTIQKVKAK